MPRKRSPEEVRRLKAEGIFDVGTSYLPIGGFERITPKKRWDEEEPDDE